MQTIMLFFGIIVGLAVMGLVLWWSVLYHQFGLIFNRSSHFPTKYSVGPPDGPPVTLVVMGDSTAFGTGASSLQATFPCQVAQHLASGKRHVQVINLAVVGARLADVVQKQFPAVQRLHPTYVVISVGANDATHFTSKTEYRQSLYELMTGLRRLTGCTVAIANPPDMGVVPALPYPYRWSVARRAQWLNDA
ncbi:MAG: SGNH/GDSL hydrolase family protein, partial [Armatimonadota bacterium]|nr:SGNH/GDSL hydrolase family protein [Armatimonadota bacterium]